MKKKYLVVVFALVFSVLPVAVYAQGDQTNPKRLEREKRISERISRIEPKLSDEQKTRYKASCKGAQTKVSAHLKNAEKFSEKHDIKFNDLIERTDKLIERLKSGGKDTAALETALSNSAQANEKVKSAYENYTLALSDAAELDCQVDPEGLRASIDEAKQEFQDLNKLRQDVRKAIKQDLKTALQALLSAN